MKHSLHSLLFLLGLIPKVSGESLISDMVWSGGVHAGQVQTVALSSDESIVASASTSDESIKLWKFGDTSLLKTLAGHSNGVTSVTFSSDRQYLVSASYDHTIRIWQVSDGNVVRTWTEGAAGVTSIALSPDNSLIAAGSGTPGYPSPFDGAVRIWNTNGTLVRALTNNVSQISGVTFSPDGQLISAISVNGAVYVWHVGDGNLAWIIPGGIGGWSGKVMFSPNSQWLAYGAGSGLSYLGLRNANTGLLSWQTNAHSGDLNGLAFSESGNLLVSVGSRNDYNAGAETNYPSIILWNPVNGDRVGIVPTTSASVSSVVLTGSGDRLLTGEGTSLGANHTFIRLWQTNGVLARDWKGHSGSVTALAFSTNGNTLASGGSADRTVKLWRGTNGTLLRTLEGPTGAVTGLAMSSDGSKVVVGDNWSTSSLLSFRVNDGGLVWEQSIYPNTVSGISYSPGSPALAVGEAFYGGTPYSITLRNETNGVVFQTISNLTTSIVALAFLPSNRVAALTRDGAARFWQTNGVLSHSFNVTTGFTCATFSSEGAVLVVGYTNRDLRLISTADGVVQRTYSGHSNVPARIGLSTDGEMLFSAAMNELLLWRVKDGALLKRYTQEILSPASLAVSPRGDSFALGRTDDTLLVARKPDFFLPPVSESGNLILRFSGVSGINYTVETSSDLQIWFPHTNVSCIGPAVSVSVPISALTNCFYRLAR
ncbi:MAG TPA: WD40 repeat domain-containing protein [Candidatus Paceibacterota bacterium]|nr:WD40 repeat domain-containing protein [Candidatus Paceibacterota bacterium]